MDPTYLCGVNSRERLGKKDLYRTSPRGYRVIQEDTRSHKDIGVGIYKGYTGSRDVTQIAEKQIGDGGNVVDL